MDHSGHGDTDDENACSMQMSVCYFKDKKCLWFKKKIILNLYSFMVEPVKLFYGVLGMQILVNFFF